MRPELQEAVMEVLAEAASMGAAELADNPHVCITMDVPIDELDDPLDHGIHAVVGPFGSAVDAMAYAAKSEAQLNAGGPIMFRIIVVPLVAPEPIR